MDKLWMRFLPLALGFALVVPASANDPSAGNEPTQPVPEEPVPQEPEPLDPSVPAPRPGEPNEPTPDQPNEPTPDQPNQGMEGDLQVAFPNPNALVRPIYAVNVPEGQTPYVVITSKTLTGECKTREEPMTLLPAEDFSEELCAELGGSAELIDGEIQGCTIGEELAQVWVYRFKRLETELNFNVVLRDGTELVGESGWYPEDEAGSNRCPRDM